MIPLTILAPYFIWSNLKRNNVNIEKKDLFNFAISILLIGWIGALFFSKILSINNAITNELLSNTEYWFTGQNWYGGFFFALTYIFIVLLTSKESKRENILSMLDSIAIFASISLFVGKIGCFVAGHTGGCSGIETSSVIGVEMPNENFKRVPRQLFDSIFHLLLAIVLLIIQRKAKIQKGGIAFLYIVISCSYLVLSDFFSPNKKVLYIFSTPQILYLICIIYAFISLFVIRSKKSPTNH